jgi:hypothetical protein
MKALLVGAALAAGLFGSPAFAGETARYTVQVDATWTAKSHPLEYPGDAHFSGIVGATHNGNYHIFKDGGIATDGLEALSERGAHSPLDQEIKAAIAKGDAGVLFESDPLFSFPGTLSASFDVDAAHPYVSVAAMVAPSPDWFTGISSVRLHTAAGWVDRVTLPLRVWDAGTDFGTTYHADDADAQPRQSVRLNASPHFLDKAGVKTVGTITFTRVKGIAAN